jgi:short-subunit dehydrogenase
MGQAMTNPMRGLLQAWRRRWWRPDAAALAAYAGLRPMVVVTGASDGIGLALARRFAKAGSDILLVARRPEPLEQAAAGIRADFKVEAVALPLDVTTADAIGRIEAALAERRAYADVLVNSAGIGLSGPFLEQSPEAISQLVDLNVRTLTLLTRHFLAGMRARGRGGILNLASLGGYVPGPYQAAYYASKAYVMSLSEALAAETAGEGVRVCALAPGPVATPFHERMQSESALYLRLLPVSSPDSVARAGYVGFALGWRVVVPGVVSPVLALAMRLMPHRMVIPIVGWLLTPRGQGHDARR